MPPAFDFDYHVHTIYSGHSGPEMFVPAVMARAAESGLRRLMIVEHAPALVSETLFSTDEWLSGRNQRTAVEAILSEVRPRRGQLPGTEFLVGAEVDADPVRMDGSLLLKDLSGLDAALAATHALPGGEAFWFAPPELSEGEKAETLERWLAWIENVVAGPAANILAHPGAELHNCGLTGDFGAPFRRAFEPVLKKMAEGRTAFEVNEAALRRLTDEAIEGYVRLVGLARELGVRFTAGSDAHRGSHVGDFVLVPRAAELAGLAEADFWHPELAASLA